MARIKDKVSVVCAFRIMQSVYSPLIKFYKEMEKNGQDDYIALLNKFCLVGRDKALENNIDFFKDVDMSYTINVVSKNIVKLYDIYNKDYGDNFLGAIASILGHVFKDCNKDVFA